MSAPFPILFITSASVEEAILSSGLVKRLHDEIDYAQFTIAGGADVEALFAEMPCRERFIVSRPRPWTLEWLTLWLRARPRAWGLIVDTLGVGMAKSLSAKKRAVRKPPLEGPQPHAVEEAALLLKLEDDPPAPYLFTSEETEARADQLLGKGGGPILALGPGAEWVGKTWPAERFNQIAARLLGPDGQLEGGRLLLLGGEADREVNQTVRGSVARDRVIDLTGKTDLLTAYACLKRVRLFIGNDTPLMHLAAAAGAPSIGLFGPSDDFRFSPWGKRAKALRGPRSYEDFKRIDPQLNQAINHMLDLPVGAVLDASLKLLRDTEPKRKRA
jgi:ADP-heptose:LPS heptosyltransferase